MSGLLERVETALVLAPFALVAIAALAVVLPAVWLGIWEHRHAGVGALVRRYFR